MLFDYYFIAFPGREGADIPWLDRAEAPVGGLRTTPENHDRCAGFVFVCIHG